MLETVVFQELVRRGFTVTVGKLGTKEIDFVADRGSERLSVRWPTSCRPPTPAHESLGCRSL
jgi:predicted AAA+ superfamily ATPase